jgi:plasmid maintenance system antidote protein VapI
MAVYVRVRDVMALRQRIGATVVTQVHLASILNTSPARISQLVSARPTAITVTAAAAIELALGVPRGTFFEIDDSPDLVAPYIATGRGAA